MNAGNGLLLLILETGTVATRLGDLNTILVAQLVSLLYQLLHLLHDHLVLLLVLLLVGLLRLLVARREIGLLLLLRLLRRLVPRIGNVFTANGASSASLLLSLTCGLF